MVILSRLLLLIALVFSLDSYLFVLKHGFAHSNEGFRMLRRFESYFQDSNLIFLPERYHISNGSGFQFLPMYKHPFPSSSIIHSNSVFILRDASLEQIYTFIPNYSEYNEYYDTLSDQLCLLDSRQSSLYSRELSQISFSLSPSWFYRFSTPLDLKLYGPCDLISSLSTNSPL